jgi:hypothetical protein
MGRHMSTVAALPSILVARLTGEAMMGKYTGGPVSTEAIARRAFELWERRGRRDGYDVEDWLRAEHELTRKDARP